MDEEKNIKFLTKLRSALEDDAITRSEFVKAFEAVVKIVKDIKDTNSKEMTAIHQTITALSNKMQSDVSNEMSSAEKKSMDYCMKEMQKMYEEHEKKMSQMDEKMAMVQDGLDGKDADEAKMVAEVLSKVPPAPFLTSVEIRDRLEILKDDERLDISAIKGLEEKLEKRISTIPRGGGGTSAAGVAHAFKYIAHTEEPTGLINGANTTYTVKNNIWWIAGFTLNGEQVAQLPNFTYANKTITFSSALPAVYSGKDFEIKYIGT